MPFKSQSLCVWFERGHAAEGGAEQVPPGKCLARGVAPSYDGAAAEAPQEAKLPPAGPASQPSTQKRRKAPSSTRETALFTTSDSNFTSGQSKFLPL